MAAKVRLFDRRYIRLNEPLLAHVEHLARLAGVTSSDVVTFVLTEAFEESGALERPAEAARVPAPAPKRSRGPGDVIPIRRRSQPIEPTRPTYYHDPPYLRRQAAEVRGLSRAARVRAADACRAADHARAKATEVLELTEIARALG